MFNIKTLFWRDKTCPARFWLILNQKFKHCYQIFFFVVIIITITVIITIIQHQTWGLLYIRAMVQADHGDSIIDSNATMCSCM